MAVVLTRELLAQLGLAGLPDKAKDGLLGSMRKEMEIRIGEQLVTSLTDAQTAEFESFLDLDMDAVRSWLAVNVPRYESDPLFAQFPMGLDPDGSLAEYCQAKWLGLHCPTYRDIVAAVHQCVCQEVLRRAPFILESLGLTVEDSEHRPELRMEAG